MLLKHALKNAFLPVLELPRPGRAAAMTGSFVVEKVFAVPGIGQHFVDAVLSKDLTLIMGVVLVYSTMLIVFNLIVDVLYAWVDPRIALLSAHHELSPAEHRGATSRKSTGRAAE